MTTETRDAFVDYLSRQVIGPWGGEEEELRDQPHQRYLMGTLYPRGTSLDAETEGDIADEGGGSVAGGQEGENAP